MKRLIFLALALSGCSANDLLDTAMHTAKVPAPHASMRVGDRMVLAGDLHCHVLPPDSPHHVTRELESTLKLAEQQGPGRSGHVWIRGRWQWTNGQYEWVPGHWERERAGYQWYDGEWRNQGGTWVWVQGEWRASAQAPVHTRDRRTH